MRLNYNTLMIAQIEAVQPEYLVFVNIYTSWLVRPKTNKLIFNWSQNYKDQYYYRVGVVDIISPEKTIYRWDHAAIEYQIQSKHFITVYRKRPDIDIFK